MIIIAWTAVVLECAFWTPKSKPIRALLCARVEKQEIFVAKSVQEGLDKLNTLGPGGRAKVTQVTWDERDHAVEQELFPVWRADLVESKP